MSRNPENNPLERMERLLLDFEEVNNWAAAVLNLLPAQVLVTLPDFPRTDAFVEEGIRFKLTRSRTLANRKSMRRCRQRSEIIRARGRPLEEDLPQELEIDPQDLEAYKTFNGTSIESSPDSIQDPFAKEKPQ